MFVSYITRIKAANDHDFDYYKECRIDMRDDDNTTLQAAVLRKGNNTNQTNSDIAKKWLLFKLEQCFIEINTLTFYRYN